MNMRRRNTLNLGALACTAWVLLSAAQTRASDGATDDAVLHDPAVTHSGTSYVQPRPAYPATRRDALVEHRFGQDIADPYRWLEADARSSPEVSGWVASQNAASASYLAGLPGRHAIAGRIRALYDYERFSLPRKGGHSYFYLRNTGLQNQPALYVREGLKGTQRLLLDPNSWSADGTSALDDWAPSPTGRWLAYSVQQGGSDWRSVRVVNVRDGAVLEDRLDWVNDTNIGWVGDKGFFYSRFPAPSAQQQTSAPSFDKAIWFHRVGTSQAADELVFATPDHREWGHKAVVTSDGRWAVITSEASTLPARAVHVVDLAAAMKGYSAAWVPIPLVPGMAHDWKLVDGIGNRLWFITNDGAPHYRLVQVDLGRKGAMKTVVPESAQTLTAGRMVGDRIILSYLENGSSSAVFVDMRGRPGPAISLSSIGSASGFAGRPGDPETFYQFSSFNQPPAIFRLDMRSGEATPFAVPKLAFNPADFLVEQRTYPSRDGTKVPMYLVRKRSLASSNKPAPTLLYGYGGFDISLTPGYSPVRMAWLEAGGVFALANIRGGGEFGRDWYDAGRLDRKQNSFDDFIAAGEYLIREGVTPKGGLAVQGGSNGGMMVGAVVNQRPDLFAAANPDVGVMDMLRFDRFTSGRFWTDDYGSPEREADWKVLRAYSPYHNVHAGNYPAILVTTADSDDRVVPAHSFKYVAALQAAPIGDRPHLLRVETKAGHGSGKPVDKVIAGGADVLAFLARWTGLSLGR